TSQLPVPDGFHSAVERTPRAPIVPPTADRLSNGCRFESATPHLVGRKPRRTPRPYENTIARRMALGASLVRRDGDSLSARTADGRARPRPAGGRAPTT